VKATPSGRWSRWAVGWDFEAGLRTTSTSSGTTGLRGEQLSSTVRRAIFRRAIANRKETRHWGDSTVADRMPRKVSSGTWSTSWKPISHDEGQAAALQYVGRVAGRRWPSAANAADSDAARSRRRRGYCRGWTAW